ncbi:PAS domain-containing sensor histidine kinase [Actinoplanes sp. OR16]|uniref:PAS domain-containing sensor histidine kinase n=1 Tax=Actinoplanes sp. OR16 TaxID=946334 RepID=UPI000FDB6B7D|nr:PAS domain-containing sensor histidine kinase [Actinoplanes sp. OR16]
MSADGAVDYRLLFRGAPAALLVLDPDLCIVEVTESYLAATRRSREELLGRLVFAAFPDNPDDPAGDGPARLRASLERVLREHVTDVMDIQKYDIPQPGGGFETRHWAPVNAPIFGPDGELRHVVHRVEDVTAFVEARQTGQDQAQIFAREQLQKQNQTLRAIADILDIAVIGCDGTGRPLLYNQAARDVVGDRLGGAPAEEWPRRLHLHDQDGRPLDPAYQPLVRALRGEPVGDVEVVTRIPGEPRRIFRLSARPLTGQPPLAAVVTLRDVTVRRTSARVQQGELEVTHLVAQPHPPDGVLDEVMRIVAASVGWVATSFWTVDDVTRQLRREAWWSEPGFTGCDRDLPHRALCAAEPIWAPAEDAGALAIPVPAGRNPLGVLVCYADTAEISEGARAAVVTGIGARLGEFLERRRAERLAAELDRTRDEYIALVGHELRTPLTSIQSYADLLSEDPALDGEQREAVAVMRRNATTLHGIVMRLLDVAGLRTGRIDLLRDAVDLTALAAAAADQARARAGDRVAVEVTAPAAVTVEGDPARLREVVDELLANALTWAAEATTVTLDVHEEGSAAVLAVTDTGAEIKAHEHEHLFDLFFRGEAARHSGIPGNGLGLTAARAIVEQHGGTLMAGVPGRSRDGATTFTVRLPAH